MKKKLLFLMTLALIGWSNVWATAGDPVDWYMSTWSGELSTTSAQFKKSAIENVYVIDDFEVRATNSLYYTINNNAWSTTYGYGVVEETVINATVNATGSPVSMVVKSADDANGWLGIEAGHYKVTFNETASTIQFDYINLVIDEDATVAPTMAASKYNVTLKRTLSKDKWQTICVPLYFSQKTEWSTTDFTNYFGEGTQVAELTSATENTLTFESVDILDYNKPYLIKPTKDITSIEVGVTYVNDFSPTEVEQGNYEFIGTNAQKKLAVGTYYVAGGNIHQVKTENKTNIKATRAYFRAKDSGLAREMRFIIDGEVTSIDLIEIPEEENVIGDIYNLNGQRMDKPFESLPAGVYIVNGKKLIKK